MADNELIADFMGMKLHIPNNPKASRYYREFDNLGYVTADHYQNKEGLFKSLAYERSWNRLMPVVEKINDLSNWNFTLSWDGVYVYDDNYKYTAQGKAFYTKGKVSIDTVYKAVVYFIKWYSNQPQKAS